MLLYSGDVPVINDTLDRLQLQLILMMFEIWSQYKYEQNKCYDF